MLAVGVSGVTEGDLEKSADAIEDVWVDEKSKILNVG